MKIAIFALWIGIISVAAVSAQTQPATTRAATTQAGLTADSQRQPGVPIGKMFHIKFDQSKIFPGTVRDIAVYVPAQYTGEKPACVYVGLDGLGFNASIVFDNLIAKKEMPVTIGIGLPPGNVASSEAPVDPRFDRSMEFDGLNDSLARFVLDEVLPEVEKQKTPDGLPIILSKDPNDRCTGGASTGGIGAFTLAWERPDAFRRVFTAIGTFVGMRGGDRYPVLIRKTEPKPIRVFMEDGSSDEWGGGPEVGDWWMSNQTVERALEFAGYQVQHVWGTHGHDGKPAAIVFPDAMRWLWKDWPQPVVAGQSQNLFLKAILQPGEGWKLVADGYGDADALASDEQGNVFFRDAQSGKTFEISDQAKSPVELPWAAGKSHALAAGPDGRLYVGDNDAGNIVAVSSGSLPAVIASGIHADHLVVTHDRNVYATEQPTADGQTSTVWLIRPTGEKVLLDEGLNHASGIVISPDGLWLAVFETSTHFGYSYRVKTDGTVEDKQRFYWLHVPDWADDSGAGSACADIGGRLYVATRMGVQVMDRNGRSRAILPIPGGEVTSVCFGGPKLDVLYVTSGGSLYRRAMKVPGVSPATTPIKLPPGSAG